MQCRNEKSPHEKVSLESIHNITIKLMQSTSNVDDFRKKAQQMGYKSFALFEDDDCFIQKRCGLQHEGLCSDVCDAIPKTPEWEEHIHNCKRNIVRIKSELVAGKHINEIEKQFALGMQEENLNIQGSVIYGIGYENLEYPGNKIEDNSVYTISVMFTPINNSSKSCLIKTLAFPIKRHIIKPYRGVSTNNIIADGDNQKDTTTDIVNNRYVDMGVFGLGPSKDLVIAKIVFNKQDFAEDDLYAIRDYLENDPRFPQNITPTKTVS